MSADGRLVAFESGGGLFVRDRALGQTTVVPGPASCCRQTPAISGDGAWVAHLRADTLYLAGLAAGASSPVASGVSSGTGFM